MEQPRMDAEAAAFRLTITNSFLLGAVMITLSLNISTIKQAFVAGVLGTTQWLLAVSIALMLFATLILLFVNYIILVNMPLAMVTLDEKLRRLQTARNHVGVSAFLVLASYGSLFLVSFGLASPWSWTMGGISYGSAVLFVVLRRYYLARFASTRRPAEG